VSPIVLRTAGIDLILGMDWMMQQEAEIQCKRKSVVLNQEEEEFKILLFPNRLPSVWFSSL
jgi:hypothetical protein